MKTKFGATVYLSKPEWKLLLKVLSVVHKREFDEATRENIAELINTISNQLRG